MSDMRNDHDAMVIALTDARDAIKTAHSAVQESRDLARKAVENAEKANSLMHDAFSLAREWQGLAEKLKAEREVAREAMLEWAIRLEVEQQRCSGHDDRHADLRVANERLNGVYGCMPSLFNMTQAECMDMVRTAAQEQMA